MLQPPCFKGCYLLFTQYSVYHITGDTAVCKPSNQRNHKEVVGEYIFSLATGGFQAVNVWPSGLPAPFGQPVGE